MDYAARFCFEAVRNSVRSCSDWDLSWQGSWHFVHMHSIVVLPMTRIGALQQADFSGAYSSRHICT
jgi:hypothetical protein